MFGRMILVTGITGHSGRYFLQELKNSKYENTIRCIVRETSKIDILQNCGLKVETCFGDLNDEAFLDKCMKGIDTVVHIASIRYSKKIMKAAIDNQVKRAVCVHTTGIYSKFKAASEEYKAIDRTLKEMIEGTDIQLTILQPTMIYGDMCDHNMSRFIKMVDKLKLFPVINHGSCMIQPVNARDLGKAYYQVLTIPADKAGTLYNLSGDKPIQLIEVLRIISNTLGKRTIFISFPLWLGVLLARTAKILTLGKIDYIEKIQRMSEDRCFSHEDAEKDFGYKPESFDIGIAREITEYKAGEC